MSRFTSIKIILQIAVVGAVLIWFHLWSLKIPVVKVNQEDWDYLVKKYVKDGAFDLDKLWLDIKRYHGYLQQVGSALYTSDIPREEVVAFWINAHNAAVVQDLLNRKAGHRIIGTALVKKTGVYRAQRTKYTLDKLETHVLEVSNDPRVFFALYDGDVGLRGLRAEAYTAAKLNQQLEEQTALFFSQNGNVYIDYENNVLHLPGALVKVAPYFEKQAGSFEAFVARYSSGEISEYIRTKEPRVVFGK